MAPGIRLVMENRGGKGLMVTFDRRKLSFGDLLERL